MKEQEQVLLGRTADGGFAAPLMVDRAGGVLRGPGGAEQVDPKVMQVFGVLLDREGEVVPREDLISAAWPAATVTDEVLTRCIYALRGHLERAGGDATYRQLLETLPKRGYRLNASVGRAPAHPARTHRRYGALGLAVAALLGVIAWFALTPRNDGGGPGEETATPDLALAIAVLPFVDLGPDGSEQYFADGLSEELINHLANTLDIRVIARTSSFSFRDANVDIRTIAERLAVTHVLEGSVRRSDDQVRVTAQLIDTGDSGHLWSNTYDVAAGDMLAVQDGIAADVAAALHLQLSPPRPAAGADHSPNPEAHEAYLRGTFHYRRRDPGDVARALGYFEDAVRADPDYAAAWVGIAAALNILQHDERDGVRHMTDDELMARREKAVFTALSLAPDAADVHARAAQYFADAGRPARAEEHATRAAELDPDNPLVLGQQSSRAAWRGDFAEATRLVRRSLVADPLASATVNNLAIYLLADGRAEEAERELRQVDGLLTDATTGFRIQYVDALILQGRYGEALTLIESWPDDADRDEALAIVYAGLGLESDSDAVLARLDALPPLEKSVRRAAVLAARGEVDACFASLEVLQQWPRSSARDDSFDRWALKARLSPYLNRLDDPRWAAMWSPQERP